MITSWSYVVGIANLESDERVVEEVLVVQQRKRAGIFLGERVGPRLVEQLPDAPLDLVPRGVRVRGLRG